jgi:hypothetical protein
MDTLCKDIIGEILKHVDPTATASFLSINKYCYDISKTNTVIKNRKIISKELEKTIINSRKYYTSDILDLKIGDRVTDRINNYRVYNIKKRTGILQVIDMYGNCLDEYIPMKVYNVKKYKMKNIKDNSFWSTIYYDDYLNAGYTTTIVNKLLPGIIKHEYGPMIKHVDSHYLKYITEPQYIHYSNTNLGTPVKNILATVYYKWSIHEYYVHYVDDDYVLLKIVTNDKDIKDMELELPTDKINDKWVIKNKKYTLVYFGGWNNKS